MVVHAPGCSGTDRTRIETLVREFSQRSHVQRLRSLHPYVLFHQLQTLNAMWPKELPLPEWATLLTVESTRHPRYLCSSRGTNIRNTMYSRAQERGAKRAPRLSAQNRRSLLRTHAPAALRSVNPGRAEACTGLCTAHDSFNAIPPTARAADVVRCARGGSHYAGRTAVPVVGDGV